MDIKDMTIVLAGGSGTIGRVVAVEMARLGCDIVCHYNKNQQQGQQIIEQAKSFGVGALAIQADLTDEKQIAGLWESVEIFSDKPKVLLNMTGLFERVELGELSGEKIDETFDINFKATALMCKGFVELLKRQKACGKIINFSGVGGIRPWAEYSAYCAS
jgi:3-oxoacyl-[acyl-carrier protein] reductase